MIKKYKRTIILYIFIVIIPTILGSYYFIEDRNNKDLYEREEDAKWFASIHESYWDEFIRDTVTTLEMLSMTARTIYNDLNKIKPLLDRAHASDPRYGGIYLLNTEGEMITGSNDYLSKDSFLDEDFVMEVIQTKDIVISNKQFILENGQSVIGLSAPVTDESNELIAVSVALLRLDYIENIMKVLTPDSEIIVLNAYDEALMKINTTDQNIHLDDGTWITKPIVQLPWKIKVKVNEPMDRGGIRDHLKVIGLVLILTHVLFLLILYLLLKRQATIEKQKNEAQKLELVGTLAASTAHEIRNPLTGIKGLVQLLSEKYDHPNDQFYFSVINKEIERINEIASEFLILGKPTAQKLVVEDMTKVLTELYPLISTEASLNNSQIHYDIPTHPILVNCTKHQMKQVVLNITRNAFEASMDGGLVSVTLSEKKYHCELIIADNGTGIPSEMLEKIFTPFFTSKEAGTGLGLVVCQRILQSFGGKILITSKENKGTTVTIELPLEKNGNNS